MKEESFDVISIGSATRDIFLKSDQFRIIKDHHFTTGQAECVALGSKIEIEEMMIATGGAGTNSAVSFARKGLTTATICRVGRDPGGRAITENLENEGVATRFIQEDSREYTGYSILLSLISGERTVLVHRGASEKISPGSIPWRQLKTKWFYISSIADDLGLLRKISDFARVHKINVAINPGSRELKVAKRLKEVLIHSAVLIVNREEASRLTGVPFIDEPDILKALRKIVPQGLAVVTDGPNGLFVVSSGKIYKAGIYPEKAVVDRTGAGDAFGSGFVSVLIKSTGAGKEFSQEIIKEAIRAGSANATSVVEHMGAKTGLLKKSQLRDPRWRHLNIESHQSY